MQFGVAGSSEASIVPESGGGGPTAAEASREREQLLARIKQLEAQLERYRTHAERTSKLFQSVTSYAQWVRERARRDSELALRKANARVARLSEVARDLEKTELELARAREELARVQALAHETRARLSTFVAAGLEALKSEGRQPLDDSLRERVEEAGQHEADRSGLQPPRP